MSMKKIVCLLSISLILSLSACSQREQADSSDVSFQPPMEGVCWGMMPEEVMELLELPEECVLSDNGTVMVLQCEDQNIFGQSADVALTFDTAHQMGLLNMNIRFAEPSGESLAEALSEAYGESCAAAGQGVPCLWESEKIEDLSEEVQERFQFMLVRDADSFSQEARWDTIKSQPLVTVTLSEDVLNYYGGNMAAYQIFGDDAAYGALCSALSSGDI